MSQSSSFPKSTYLISATTTDVNATPKHGSFSAVTCTVAGTVKVRGGGVYEYVDVSDASDVHTSFIDPTTGVVFADDAAMNTRGDGFYQKINSVYGRFDSVKSDGTFTGFAYT